MRHDGLFSGFFSLRFVLCADIGLSGQFGQVERFAENFPPHFGQMRHLPARLNMGRVVMSHSY